MIQMMLELLTFELASMISVDKKQINADVKGKGIPYGRLLLVSMGTSPTFRFTKNRYKANHDCNDKEEKIAHGKWSQDFINIHNLPPFRISIEAKNRNVKDTAIPSRNSINEGLMAVGSTLGKKYPTTLYRATPLERSSAYRDNNLYWEGESFFNAITTDASTTTVSFQSDVHDLIRLGSRTHW